MEQSPSWKSCSTSQIPSVQRKLKVHYHVHTSQPLAPNLEPVICSLHPSVLFLLFWAILLSSHLSLGLPSDLIPSSFRIRIVYAFPFLSHACYILCPSYLRFNHVNNIWCAMWITKSLNMWFPPVSCQFLPLSSRLSAWRPSLKRPSMRSSLNYDCKRTDSCSYQSTTPPLRLFQSHCCLHKIEVGHPSNH